MMRYSDIQVVLQEVPGEVSICFTITGCPINCLGCHSPYLWKKGSGELLTLEKYHQVLKKYQCFASCVLFMGGEWHQNELIEYLELAQKMGFSTCLYTGLNEVKNEIKFELTWLKTGQWIKEYGGLTSSKTNQKFIHVKSNKILNHLFIKN